jgi:hypothetical protein
MSHLDRIRENRARSGAAGGQPLQQIPVIELHAHNERRRLYLLRCHGKSRRLGLPCRNGLQNVLYPAGVDRAGQELERHLYRLTRRDIAGIVLCDLQSNEGLGRYVSLSGQGDLVVLAPSYTFAEPVLGGQLAVSLASVYGRSAASIAGSLTVAAGPLVVMRNGILQDSLVSYGDLYLTVTMRWNMGVNNFTTYVSGDIPVGDYDPMRLANIGIGHGAIDAGGG